MECPGAIANNDQLLRCLAKWDLVVPTDYQPHARYTSSRQIAECLGLEQNSDMLIYDATNGDLHDNYRSSCVSKGDWIKFDKGKEGAFFGYSATGMWQLMNFALRRKGTRQLCVDGTGGICQDQSTLIVIGSLSVKYRKTSDNVTASLRPIVYLKAGGERQHVYCLTLYAMRALCWRLFRVELGLDWGTSDHADAFVSSHLCCNKFPQLCEKKATNKVLAIETNKFGQDNEKPASTHYENVIPEATLSNSQQQVMSSTSSNPMTTGLPIVTQLSNDEQSLASSQGNDADQIVDVFTVSVDAEGNEECTFYVVHGVTLCYFHVAQHFQKNDSFVKRIKNRQFAVTKSKTRGDNTSFYEHVALIHHCKTSDQRNRACELIIRHWISLGEDKCADLFYRSHCKQPYCNWNYSCTGVAGVHPSNCPSESTNEHSIKGREAVVQKNASLEATITESIPSLLEDDALKKQDPCTVVTPDVCSGLMVTVTTFLEKGVDIIQLGDSSWICNARYNIGVPLCENRRRLIAAAEDGLEHLFREEGMNDATVCKAMVDTTRCVCFVTKHDDGLIIGDCENCIKRLGHNCPGACFIRNQEDRLKIQLHTRRKTHANARNTLGKALSKGTRMNSYTGGPQKTEKKSRSAPPMLEGNEDYLRTLSRPQLVAAIKYLCLATAAELKGSRLEKTEDLLQLLLRFKLDPRQFRSEASKKRATENHNGNSFPDCFDTDDLMKEIEPED